MAKKKAKGAPRVRCLGCGKGMKRSRRRCPRCRQVSPLFAGKSSGQLLGFIGKSAGGAAVAAGPRCGSCFRSQPPGRRHCGACGALMPGQLRLVTKSAAGLQYSDQFWRESNPATREVLWHLMHGHDTGGAA